MPTDRRTQPKCRDCHHPKSFHGGGTTRCRALGCECEAWAEVEVEEQESEPVLST